MSAGGEGRPFRLLNTRTQQTLRWRYYKTFAAANWGALKECRWAEVGLVIEVYDARTMDVLAAYKRRVDSIGFTDYKGNGK